MRPLVVTLLFGFLVLEIHVSPSFGSPSSWRLPDTWGLCLPRTNFYPSLTAGDWGRAGGLRGGNNPNWTMDFPLVRIRCMFLPQINTFRLSPRCKIHPKTERQGHDWPCRNSKVLRCREAESNHRHWDLQSDQRRAKEKTDNSWTDTIPAPLHQATKPPAVDVTCGDSNKDKSIK